MANSIQNYVVDPAILTPQSVSGKASIMSDPSAAFWAALFRTANLQRGYEVLDTTATNLDVEVYESRLKVSGTMAFTLPNGKYNKQRKKVVVESAASIPAATLTVTTPDTTTGFACSGGFFLDTAGQWIEFEWIDDIATPAWRAVAVHRAGTSGANGVVIGTTVLTNKNMWQEYCLSVTGTVTSSTTKALPNGSAVGERITINVTTAATIPAGELDGTFRVLGAAKTKITAIDATTEVVCLEWDGQAWCVMSTVVASGHPTFA